MGTTKIQSKELGRIDRRILPLFATLLAFCPLLVRAQVTIGSGEPPVAGALLELTDGARISSAPLVNAKKGLGMPRVKLTSLTIPAGKTLAQTIDGNVAEDKWDATEHIGLTVYNTNICIDGISAAAGLYVWTGDQWQYLGASSAYPVTDPRDGNVYLAGNFGAAGDWMLENMRYIDRSMKAKAADEDWRGRYYLYPQPNGDIDDKTAHIIPDSWRPAYGLLYTYSAATLGQQDTVDYDQGQDNSDPEHPGAREVEKVYESAKYAYDGKIVGICPRGWHIPSDREWNKLERELYNHADKYSTYTPSDLPFKAVYTNGETYEGWQTFWESGTTMNDPENNVQGGYHARGSTGDTGHAYAATADCDCMSAGWSPPSTHRRSKPTIMGGFGAYMVGYANDGRYHTYNSAAHFWTSSVSIWQNRDVRAWWRTFATYSNSAEIFRGHQAGWYTPGKPLTVPLMSVRCVRD